MSDAIVENLQRRRDEYVHELSHLAGIDSGTDDKQGVDAVQSWFEQRFNALGFETTRIKQEKWGDDLIARKRGPGKGRVLLIGHADTVYPRGTAAKRPLTIQGDKILGPGTCDMKAGLLTGLYAMEALDAAGWNDFETITFLIVSDEEIEDRHSAGLLMEEGPKHHAALTLEAARANGDVVTSRKATRWAKIEAIGKAAHAGVEPEKGRSAVLALAHVIVESFKLNGKKPGMTLNPGRITGGANPNIVADYASVMCDLRAWSNADLRELTKELQAVCDTDWVPGVKVNLILEGDGMPAMERSAGTIRLESHAIGIANELGFPLKGAATGGGSDVSYAVHKGTPGLDGLGPIGGLDHGPDEYIELSSIVPRTALLAKLLQAICADGELTHG